MTERFNASELLAVIAARQLRDDTTVFAGVGGPLLAAALAKRRHAPRLTMVIEGGIIGPADEKRRFVEGVDFVTSPSWIRGDGSRKAAGLLFGGVSRVVTTLGILGFDPESKRMRIEATHPGVSTDTLRQNTGFALLEALRIETTEPPSDDELEMLRALDPERRFLG